MLYELSFVLRCLSDRSEESFGLVQPIGDPSLTLRMTSVSNLCILCGSPFCCLAGVLNHSAPCGAGVASRRRATVDGGPYRARFRASRCRPLQDAVSGRRGAAPYRACFRGVEAPPPTRYAVSGRRGAAPYRARFQASRRRPYKAWFSGRRGAAPYRARFRASRRRPLQGRSFKYLLSFISYPLSFIFHPSSPYRFAMKIYTAEGQADQKRNFSSRATMERSGSPFRALWVWNRPVFFKVFI